MLVLVLVGYAEREVVMLSIFNEGLYDIKKSKIIIYNLADQPYIECYIQ